MSTLAKDFIEKIREREEEFGVEVDSLNMKDSGIVIEFDAEYIKKKEADEQLEQISRLQEYAIRYVLEPAYIITRYTEKLFHEGNKIYVSAKISYCKDSPESANNVPDEKPNRNLLYRLILDEADRVGAEVAKIQTLDSGEVEAYVEADKGYHATEICELWKKQTKSPLGGCFTTKGDYIYSKFFMSESLSRMLQDKKMQVCAKIAELGGIIHSIETFKNISHIKCDLGFNQLQKVIARVKDNSQARVGVKIEISNNENSVTASLEF